MLSHRVPLRCLLLILMACAAGSISQAASPRGRWRGEWNSVTSGHSGPLRARIRPIDGDTYRALFVGRFAKVVPFVYPAKLERVPGTCNRFTSVQRLPLLGDYHMTATVQPHHFHADFRGPRDRGTFEMSR